MTSLQLMMQLVIFSALALGLVYFLFYQPTIGAQRRARRAISGMQVGDEVVTSGGFLGRVVDVIEPEDGPLIAALDMGGGVIMRVRVSSIAELLPRPAAASPNADLRLAPEPPSPKPGAPSPN